MQPTTDSNEPATCSHSNSAASIRETYMHEQCNFGDIHNCLPSQYQVAETKACLFEVPHMTHMINTHLSHDLG